MTVSGAMADNREDSASPSVSSDSMDEERPLKKARYIWQIKGRCRWNRPRSELLCFMWIVRRKMVLIALFSIGPLPLYLGYCLVLNILLNFNQELLYSLELFVGFFSWNSSGFQMECFGQNKSLRL